MKKDLVVVKNVITIITIIAVSVAVAVSFVLPFDHIYYSLLAAIVIDIITITAC